MGSSMSRLHSSSPSLESVPDDIVPEILLLVSAHPTCLPQLSLVCKFFNRVVTDRDFLAGFRRHHCDAPPPLLGFFHDDSSLPSRFIPVGDSPTDRVSAAAFDPKPNDIDWRVLDSRHSRFLLYSPKRCGFLVWEPMSGGQRYIRARRLERKRHYEFIAGAVLCDAGHNADHGWCGDCPFAVCMVVTLDREETAHAFLYSSKDSEWEDVDSIPCAATLIDQRQGLLLGNVLYWTLAVGSILALDLDLTSRLLVEIEQPPNATDDYEDNVQLIGTEGGALCLAAIVTSRHGFQFHLWSHKDDGVVDEWVLERAVFLDELIPTAPPPMAYDYYLPERILGADGSVVFVRKEDGIFQVDLETSQFKRLCDSNNIHTIYPSKSL